jgi:hypothetical protein
MKRENDEFLNWLEEYYTDLSLRNSHDEKTMTAINRVMTNIKRRYEDFSQGLLMDCIYQNCNGKMIQNTPIDWQCKKCGLKARYINGVMFALGKSGDWGEFYVDTDILDPDYWQKLLDKIAPTPTTAIDACKLAQQQEFIKRQKEFIPNYNLCEQGCIHYESSTCQSCLQYGYYTNFRQKCYACDGSGWYDNTDAQGNSIPCGACEGTGLEDKKY